MTPFDTEPDFINEIGVKWWRDPVTTDYARSPDRCGTVLAAQGWIIERPDGFRSRLLVSEAGEVIADDQLLEGMGIKIDLLKMQARD